MLDPVLPPSPRDYPEDVGTLLKTLEDKQAEDIKVLDVRSAQGIVDYFIVASGKSSVHSRALGTHIKRTMKEIYGKGCLSYDIREKTWLVMDYGSVLVHLFEPGARAYYDLESLWEKKDSDLSA